MIHEPLAGGGVEPHPGRPFHDPAPGVRRQVRLDVEHMDEVRSRHDEIEAVLQEAQRLEQRAAAQRRIAEHLAQGLMRWLTMEYTLPMDRGEEWLLDIYHMVINEASPVTPLPDATQFQSPPPDPEASPEAQAEAQAEALEHLEADPAPEPAPVREETTQTPVQPQPQRRARKRAAPGGKRATQP